jgi:hypothetical protein
MPEVKIRKAVRAMRARSVHNSALLRSNLRNSHFQTDGIATDNNAANIQIFLCLQQFLHIFLAKPSALLSEGKSRGFINIRCGTFRYLL